MNLMNFPVLVLVLSFVSLLSAAEAGNALRKKTNPLNPAEREDFNVVVGAVLTLLALLIGFSFSMAISRYDQRKNLEEAEANAIGTEYVRADLLPAGDATKVRELLKKYIDQRVLFYTTRDDAELARINTETLKLHNDMWSAVRAAAAQNSLAAVLAIAGMNDVLNSEGFTQAAWWNRIPTSAWALMALIAMVCNLLIGYEARRRDWRIFLVVPVAVSIAFFLICDIDSPHAGTIRVVPQNLIRLAQSLQTQ